MLLVLDVGNTNIKVGLFSETELISSWRLTSDKRRTSDEYGIQMDAFFRNIDIDTKEISGIIISSVIPSMNYTIEHMCRMYFEDVSPIFVDKTLKTGIINNYDVPGKLGSDRICNCVAANKIYGGDLLVIDFGTATSFNVLNKSGEFLGGLIAPGIKVSTDALTESAALLPKIEFIKPVKVICTNTQDSVRAGVIHGFVGMVEHIIFEIAQEFGNPIKVVATGGMSAIIASETRAIDVLNPTLTLNGLALIYEMNFT
ncbi:MAG: type III pantothenate kinase [Clostridia bacterium]